MQIIYKKLDQIKEYENNPRNNDAAVSYVAQSIQDFGFKVPIIIDKNGVIVAGHTRYKASKKLNLEEVPCIVADDLNEEQVKAFRLADNKVAELAEWDLTLMLQEIESINDYAMENFGFNTVEGLNLDQFSAVSDNEAEEEPEDNEPVMQKCPHCGAMVEV